MMTFLPYSSYEKSAQVLDYRRLGNQRNEGLTILKTNLGLSNAWKSHPCTNMWKGHNECLATYIWYIIKEWKSRGYKDFCERKLFDLMGGDYFLRPYSSIAPLWYDDERIFSSHRAALLFKNYDYYKQFGWAEEPKQSYVWGEGAIEMEE